MHGQWQKIRNVRKSWKEKVLRVELNILFRDLVKPPLQKLSISITDSVNYTYISSGKIRPSNIFSWNLTKNLYVSKSYVSKNFMHASYDLRVNACSIKQHWADNRISIEFLQIRFFSLWKINLIFFRLAIRSRKMYF